MNLSDFLFISQGSYGFFLLSAKESMRFTWYERYWTASCCKKINHSLWRWQLSRFQSKLIWAVAITGKYGHAWLLMQQMSHHRLVLKFQATTYWTMLQLTCSYSYPDFWLLLQILDRDCVPRFCVLAGASLQRLAADFLDLFLVVLIVFSQKVQLELQNYCLLAYVGHPSAGFQSSLCVVLEGTESKCITDKR